MATRTINRKPVTCTIAEKARSLRVFDINEAGRLACTSGSDASAAYVVRHDGRLALACPCKARVAVCAHKLAVNWFLEARNRAIYAEMFNPCDVG